MPTSAKSPCPPTSGRPRLLAQFVTTYRMKAIYNSLVIVTLFCHSCTRNLEKESLKEADKDKVEVFHDYSIKERVVESIDISDSIDFKNYYLLSANKLFDFTSLHGDYNLDPEVIINQIKVDYFNESILVQIYYGQWSTHGNSIRLFLLDKEGVLLSEDSIMGCHYHNGTIDIIDWNNDGMDEIQFTIDWPTQSVSYIEQIERIYKISDSYEFCKVFEISKETRDCASSDSIGEVVQREYSFENKSNISVLETLYEINCADFEWHDAIKTKREINSTKYLMTWSQKENRFKK